MTGAEIVAASDPHIQKHSKFTPGMVDAILSAIADGLNISQACAAVGISRPCYNKWKDQFPAFAEALEQARETSRQEALAGIKAAGESGDWRALEAFLKMSFQADYRQGGNNINVTAQAGMQLVCDEPTRARLIELNQKLLKGGDHGLPENTEPSGTYERTNSSFQTDSI